MPRPKNPYKSVSKNFYIPEYLLSMLEREDNHSKTVTKALELYFKNKEASETWLRNRLDQIDRERENILNTLKEKENFKNNKELQLKQLQKDYNEICKFLEGDGSLNGQPYNTDRTNDYFKTRIKDYGHFLRLQKQHSKGNFSIDNLKELRRDKIG